MQPPIQSRTVPSSSVLIKITIPKRRRKKRRDGEASGSAEPEREKTLLEKLKASKGKYKVETVGMIERTVRFRGFFYNPRCQEHVCGNGADGVVCRYGKLSV